MRKVVCLLLLVFVAACAAQTSASLSPPTEKPKGIVLKPGESFVFKFKDVDGAKVTCMCVSKYFGVVDGEHVFGGMVFNGRGKPEAEQCLVKVHNGQTLVWVPVLVREDATGRFIPTDKPYWVIFSVTVVPGGVRLEHVKITDSDQAA